MNLTDALGSIADRISRAGRARFPAGSRVGDALRTIRHRLPRRPPDAKLARVIFEFGRHHPQAFVVQVGAHDGAVVDPLRAELVYRRWRGVLVEPVPYVFERLRANYEGNPRVVV